MALVYLGNVKGPRGERGPAGTQGIQVPQGKPRPLPC